MELTNYYQLLKIEPSADLDTIKKAFRTEIALYHPDRNKTEGAKAHFDMLVEAFDILSNIEKRKTYDQMLAKASSNSEMVIPPNHKEEQFEEWQYKEWQKEAKKKSDDYWLKDLKDLLLLDIFLEVGLSGLFSGTDSLLDGLGDSLDGFGDILDFF